MTDADEERPHSKNKTSPHNLTVRWRNQSDLEKEFIGSHTSFTHALQELRRALEADVIAAGYSKTEAAALVGEHLIRFRIGRDGRRLPMASDDAVRLIGVSERADAEPALPEGWSSALQLSQKRGEDYHTVVRNLKRVYNESLQEYRQQGHTDQSAVALVRQFLVRGIQPLHGKRRIWIASEKAVRKLGDSVATEGPNINSPSNQEKESWLGRLDDLLAEMIESGYSPTEAVRTIGRHLKERAKLPSDPENRSRGR